jgi:hypothetical protein
MEPMRFRINAPQVITETIDGEAIMINLGTGNYYSVAGSGAEVCGFLEQGASVERVIETLSRGYEAPREAIASAVSDLIADLEREGLIVPLEGDGDSPASVVAVPPESEARRPFDKPRLEKYTDMQDLVLLDPVHEVDERGWPHVQPAAQAHGA